MIVTPYRYLQGLLRLLPLTEAVFITPLRQR